MYYSSMTKPIVKFCIVESKGSRVERVEFRGLTGDSKTLDELFEYFKKVIEKKEGKPNISIYKFL